jgi:hypothetical protein
MIEVPAKKEAWSKDLMWLAGILLAALVLRLVAFSSFYQLDTKAIRSPDSAPYEGPALAFFCPLYEQRCPSCREAV